MGNLGKIGKPQKSKKHKKLKPVDPFNRAGRRAAAEEAKKADKTPKGKQLEDQEMSRSMKEFIRNKKNMQDQLKNPQQGAKKKKDPKLNDFQMNDDRRGMTRPVRPVPEFHKRKGERDGHFVGRAAAAAAAVVGESRFEDKYKLNANPTEDELEEKKQRKDEWKKKKAERKEKRRRKKQGETVSDEINALHKKNKEEEEKKRKAAAAAAAAASTSSSSVPKKVLTDFCDLRDDVVFGEVAMAPPTLTAKPRKAETKDNRNDNLLLTALVNNNSNNNNSNNNSNNNNNDDKTKLKKKPGKQGTLIKKAGKLKDLSALQKSNLLNERQRVVDKYRKLKSGNLGKL